MTDDVRDMIDMIGEDVHRFTGKTILISAGWILAAISSRSLSA